MIDLFPQGYLELPFLIELFKKMESQRGSIKPRQTLAKVTIKLHDYLKREIHYTLANRKWKYTPRENIFEKDGKILTPKEYQKVGAEVIKAFEKRVLRDDNIFGSLENYLTSSEASTQLSSDLSSSL